MLSPTKRSPKTTYLPLCPWSWSNSRWQIVIWQIAIDKRPWQDWLIMANSICKEARKWKDVGLPNQHLNLDIFTSRSSKLLLVISWCFLNKHPSASTDTTFDEHFGAYSLLPTTISAVQNVSEQIYHDNCRKSPIENVIDKSSTEELIFWFITR